MRTEVAGAVYEALLRTHAKPEDIEGIDLRKVVRMIHGVPDSVNWPSVSNYIRARQLLDDGVSLGEAARTVGIDRSTVRRWFPGRGWAPHGGSSAFIRKAKREMEGL